MEAFSGPTYTILPHPQEVVRLSAYMADGSQRLPIFAAVVAFVLPWCAAAQENPTTPVLLGVVTDAVSGEPVRGAMVRMAGGQIVAISNRQGRIRVRSMPSGRHEVEIGTNGFTSLRVMVSVPDTREYSFELNPAPYDLGEIRVTATARLEERRRSAPSRVEAFDRAELENAISPDIGSFVKSRGVAQFITCGEEFAPSDLPNCYWHRDGPRRIYVFIDDIQDTDGAGTSLLWAFDPRDLWSVEFLPECGELRIYTMDYQERIADGLATLRPAICEALSR